MAISNPGNEFRLGACEAPPAIISTYLGDDMTSYLEKFKNGDTDAEYKPGKKTLDLGTKSVMPFQVPAEDRNRTSPLPYGGCRFEFRAVGSAVNCSLVNTALNAIAAEKMGEIADKIEAGESEVAVAQDYLNKNWRVIFNGDNYDEENQEMLTRRGIWRIDSGVEANHTMVMDKNVALMEKLNIMTKAECEARETIAHDHYVGYVELESLSMVDMIQQHVIPSVKNADLDEATEAKLLTKLTEGVETLKADLKEIHAEDTPFEAAKKARVLRLETMVELREHCDHAEEIVPAEFWTMATYKDMLFLDQNDSTWM
jgi:glutamine synthetase